MQVNIRYLPIKAHYFFYWGGVASIWGFIAVFGKQMGISEVGVGLIFTVAPISGLIAKPVFGAVADRFKKKKMIFLFFLLLNLMAYLCVAFLPQNPPTRPVQLDCAVGQSFIRQCGRLNPHCADQVIGGFKQSSSSAMTEDSSDPSDNAIRKTLFEPCTAHCEIHAFIEGINFCQSLFPHNQPSVCGGVTRDLDDTNYLSSSTTTPSIKRSPVRQKITHPAESASSPALIKFDLILNVDAIQMLRDPYSHNNDGDGDGGSQPSSCLYMPLHQVRFEDGSFLGLSCRRPHLLKQCYMDCPNNTLLNRQLEAIQEEEELLDAMNFWMYGSLVIIAWIAMSVVESLADAMTMQTLGPSAYDQYGKQRLWGTIGWGSFQLIAGYLIDTSSQGKLLKDYTTSFYLTAGLLTIDLVVAYKWGVREVEKTKSLRRDICSVLSNIRIVVFIVACVIIGMCTGLLWNFLFWYIELLSEEEELQVSCESHQWIKLLQGLIGATQCLGELPFFFVSGWLINRLGHVHCITLVLGAFGVRFIIYSFIQNPWAVLPVELLQGVTYGVFYSTMVSYANKIAPVGTAATVIGVVQSAFLGIGVASGSLVGGLIFNKYSGKTAFRVFGVSCIIFCGIHAVLMYVLEKKFKNSGDFIEGFPYPKDRRAEPEGQEMFKISTGEDEEEEEEDTDEDEDCSFGIVGHSGGGGHGGGGM